MNKPLTAVEVSHATSPVTKRQKLMRFANIVRSRARCPLYLFNNIEYLDRGQWKYISHPASAFALAARDEVLRNAGLEDSSVADAQQFFDLSREELAEFSCVCGGSINNNKLAERIERIAAGAKWGSPEEIQMNDEIPVDPIPAADVDGFLCYRDQRGAIIARCVACRIGFVVTNETAEAARADMITHLNAVHGARP